jgi:hypothetical protein
MYQSHKRIIRHYSLLALLVAGFAVSACSSGGSGGSTSGTGSSSVEGNVSSVSMAMLDSMENKEYSTNAIEYSLTFILKSLLPVQSAFAGGTLEGGHVSLGQMSTTTNSSGYFRIDGVPPGTHEMVFSKDNQMATTMVSVGDNEMVTMQNVQMQGSQAHVGNVGHAPMGGSEMQGNTGSSGTMM